MIVVLRYLVLSYCNFSSFPFIMFFKQTYKSTDSIYIYEFFKNLLIKKNCKPKATVTTIGSVSLLSVF